MMKRIDGPVQRLVKEQVFQIVLATLHIGGTEPQCATTSQEEPKAPSEHPAKPLRPSLQQTEEHDRQNRNQKSDGALDKQGQEGVEGKQPPGPPDGSRRAIGGSRKERVQCQDDEQGHQHIHAQDDARAQEQAAREQHKPTGRTPCLTHPHIGRYPAVGQPYNHAGRQPGEQGEEPHDMSAEEPFAQHHDPQIQRRLVGIGYPVVRKGKETPVLQRLVGNAQVTQFVIRRHIAQAHGRQQGHQGNEVNVFM
ncbi:MAG: hypothetical protein PUF62_03845 [Bacteroidales bacterium]|nr:hypothetical protein [Bacteroidales bacterium]